MLAQSQRVSIASKPMRLSLIFKFLTEFLTDVSWKIRTIHRWNPFTQSYHWNNPEISVTSVTSSPRLWSTTISGTSVHTMTSSVVIQTLCLQCR